MLPVVGLRKDWEERIKEDRDHSREADNSYKREKVKRAVARLGIKG